MKDFFISYNQEDKSWAEWIAVTLSNAKYTVVFQAWDFLPGSNFVLQMQRATIECNRTIAVLSPSWLASIFTQPEWAVAFSVDPTGADRKLIPIRVRACEPPGLLRSIVYCDLMGFAEEDARQALLQAVADAPVKPVSVAFPGARSGAAPRAAPAQQGFPGVNAPLALDALTSPVKAAVDLWGLLRTTRTTFEAQARLRNRLVRQISDRLVLNPREHLEYEDFFVRHFAHLDRDERRIFDIIRSFTANVLNDYNRKMLKLIEATPQLVTPIPSLMQLKNHLLLWVAKFDADFPGRPEMCLLYVGVHEGVPFPRSVEWETWTYLERQADTAQLLKVELSPPPPTEEWSSEEEL